MNSNICTILEQRKQLAKLRKPAARYEGKYNDNPYAEVDSAFKATSLNKNVTISGEPRVITEGNYKLIDLIDKLNSITLANGYIWSDYMNYSTSITVFNSSANGALGLSSESNGKSTYSGSYIAFPLTIYATGNIIKLDNISFSILNGIYNDSVSLLTQLNSVTNQYGYNWSTTVNKLTITKSSTYKNLITLTNLNTNNASVIFSSTISGLGFANGSVNSSEYAGTSSPDLSVIIESDGRMFSIDGILFNLPRTAYTMATLLAELNDITRNYGYDWTIGSSDVLKINKRNMIQITALFGMNPGIFMSPCIFPIPASPPNEKAKGYTKEQLDMRRKSEILQYKKSASQTTGQMTKKGKYAKLFTIAGNNNICPLDLYLPTLTSSSDVPGPISTLQYTDLVPLYNIASDSDNYANLNPDVNSEFEVYYENNILVANGYNPSVNIASIIINNPTDSTRTFNITVPVGVYISGDVSGNDIYEGIYRNSSVTFGVYYNGTLVPGTSSTSTAFSNKYVKIRSTTNHSIFSGALYVGCSTISVELDTQKGFVYELRMSAATELIAPVSGNIFSSETVGVFANISTGLAPINSTLNLNSGTPVPLINPGKLTIT